MVYTVGYNAGLHQGQSGYQALKKEFLKFLIKIRLIDVNDLKSAAL